MTLDGNHLRIPNARVFGSTVLNYSRNPRRRFTFDFGVGPADDLKEAQRVGREALLKMSSILHDPPPQAIALELGDSSVQVRFLAWINQDEADLTKTRSEAIRLVKLALEDAGIELPPPEYRVVMVTGGESTDEAKPSAIESVQLREEQDTSVDDSVDQQILADAPQAGEDNLLVGVVK